MVIRTQGIQRRDDGKDCFSLTPQEHEERWASPTIFFLDLGWVRFALGKRTCLRRERAWGGVRLVSPTELVGALAPTRFNSLHARMWMTRHSHVTPCSHHHTSPPSLPPSPQHTTTTTTTTNQPTNQASTLKRDPLFCVGFGTDLNGQPMADRARAAKSRRERRLRSWLRHERMTVAAELSAALHHSRGGGAGEVRQPTGTEDGHRSRRRRWCTTPTTPNGDRPYPLQGCGWAVSLSLAPQRSDRSLRRSSREAPLLRVPSLADASAEAIDGRTFRYLLQLNLSTKKKE